MSSRSVLSFLLVTAIFTACYIPEEGCLDIEAVNYNVGADKPCCCCCNYPSLSIELQHLYNDTLSFRTGNVYPHLGNGASFLKFRYLLSDFEMVSDGDTRRIQDSISVGVDFITNDYRRIAPSNTIYELGTFRYPESLYESLSFSIGATDEVDPFGPDSFPNVESLSLDSDSLYSFANSRYFHLLLSVIPDTSIADTFSYRAICESPQQITLSPIGNSISGFNLSVPIDVNYEKWIAGIDFQTLDSAQVAQRLCEQAVDAFE